MVKSLLKAVAGLIEADTHKSDFVARLRDDALAVALTETDAERAAV